MDDYMFGEKPKWKDDYWRKLAHAGYAEVSYEDVWSLDTRLVRDDIAKAIKHMWNKYKEDK